MEIMGEYDLSVRPLASLNSDLRFQPRKIAGSEGMQVREKRESNPRERNVRIQNERMHLRSLDEYALQVARSACRARATGPLPARAALPLPRRRTPPCSCSVTSQKFTKLNHTLKIIFKISFQTNCGYMILTTNMIFFLVQWLKGPLL